MAGANSLEGEMPAVTYDEVPYESYPFPQSHPARLSTVATLMGLASPTPEKCRVLEVGFANGGNLLAMADSLPGSAFVGIEASRRQHAEAQKELQALGLENVELHLGDAAEAGLSLGDFDYIILHGVFSWVDRATQEALLALCGRCLTPNGLAYISYNTLPGWRLRGAVRDIMQFHAARFSDPRQQVEQSVALLDFLAKAGGEGAPFTAFLRSEADLLRRKLGSYVLHEYLEEHNDPVYFHDFLTRASAHSLAYVGDAEVQTMVPPDDPPEVRKTLDLLSASGQAQMEQYLDFIRCRMFRQTILCRAGRQADYLGTAERVTRLHVASAARPVSPAPDLASGAEEKFTGLAGVHIKSTEPLIKAAMLTLAEQWPASVSFDELCRIARQRIGAGGTPEGDARLLSGRLWQFYSTAGGCAVELSCLPYPGPPRPSGKPAARKLARHQASSGRQYVTNLRHEAVHLNDFERQMLPLLDGTRSHEALAADLAALVAAGSLSVQQDGKPVTDPATVRSVVAMAVGRQIEQFTLQSLLVG